jgi:hypothetical protein
MKNTQVF